MKSLKNKMGKMAIVACLIGAIVLVWGRKEIVNEKFAKNEKVIATQTIEIQENERLHLSVGADVGQTIFWSPSLKGKSPISGAFNIKYYLFSLSSLGTTDFHIFGRTSLK